MRPIRLLTGAALLAAFLVTTSPAEADCLPSDPSCGPLPPSSVQVDADPATGNAPSAEVDEPGQLAPIEAVVPMPAPRAEVIPLGEDSAAPFSSLSLPVRYQDPSDVSCGVQALGMALDGLGAGAPASSALLGFLQGHGMMYDFGTGVEELAYAAQSFGYRGSYAFHDASLGDVAEQLAAGSPVVVSLGANGAGQPGHFVTVTGVSPDGRWVSYNDPTLGSMVVSAEEFSRLWALQGNSGVAVATAPPPSAPDPMPWVALAAGVMALISTSPLGRQRMGIGGRLDSGGGASRTVPRPAPAPPRPAPRPAPAPARPAPARPAPAPARSAPAPAPVRVASPPSPARPATPPQPANPSSLFSRITSAVSNAVADVRSTVRHVANQAVTAVTNVVNDARTTASNTVNRVASAVTNTASQVREAVNTSVSRAAALVDDIADEARQIGRTVATTVSRAATAVTNAVRTTAQTVGNAVRTAATAAVSTVRTTAARVAEGAANTARNVAASALTAAHDAVEAVTPVAQRIVAAPFIAAHDAVEEATSWSRDALVSVLAPAADSFRSIADHERNPQIASWRESVLSGIQHSRDGWEQAFEGAEALGTYTLEAAADERWGDLARAAEGWRTAGEEVRSATLVSTLRALGLVAWGAITTPYRLVTQSVPNFARAVSERLDGEDRAWDVIFSGAMLEADIAGTYALARPTGLVDRANTALENRLGLSGLGPYETLPEFQPPSATGQWRNWDIANVVDSADSAYSWATLQRQGLWGPNRLLDNPPGGMVSAGEDGLVTLGYGDINSLPQGSPSNPAAGIPGDSSTRLLWTVDERGPNFILENQPWDSERGFVSHTNISHSAYSGGEAWRTGDSQITINSASGAFGFNYRRPDLWPDAAVRFEETIQFLRDIGLDVTALPFGQK